jgi:hypothetical protein
MLGGSTLDLELVLDNSSISQFSGANGVQQPAVNAAPHHCGISAAKQGYQAERHCGLLTATTASTPNSSNSSSCSSWLPGWPSPWLGRKPEREKAPVVPLRQCVGLAGGFLMPPAVRCLSASPLHSPAYILNCTVNHGPVEHKDDGTLRVIHCCSLDPVSCCAYTRCSTSVMLLAGALLIQAYSVA